MSDFQDRRLFLRSVAAAGAAWVAADLVQVEAALAWVADRQARAGDTPPFVALTTAEGAALEALTSRILPSDDGSPGAREAGVVHFIDRSLSTFNKGRRKFYGDGVRGLDQRATRQWPGAAAFAGLSAAQQDQLITEIERTPFFQAVRFDTIVGTFALPSWGGNRGHVGWQMIGLSHQPAFQPPFGYYDAEITGKE